MAAKYSGVDLSETKSTRSIIDLAPLDVDIGQKQENANTLMEALRKNELDALAKRWLPIIRPCGNTYCPFSASSLGVCIKGI